MANLTIIKTHNLLCDDGRTRRFELVPFINGDDPTNAPVKFKV